MYNKSILKPYGCIFGCHYNYIKSYDPTSILSVYVENNCGVKGEFAFSGASKYSQLNFTQTEDHIYYYLNMIDKKTFSSLVKGSKIIK
jgi:hypothetical protein